MTTEIEMTPIKVRDNPYETTSISGWGWPDQVALANFAELADWPEQADPLLENHLEYAALYFVS
jgi:hypothetical protein